MAPGSTSADLVVRVAANLASLQTDMAAAAASVKTIESAIVPAAAASSGWAAILNTLGSSFVARVAEGILLRDAVREVLHAVTDAIEAFPDLVEHTIAVGNSLFEMAMKTGSSVEGLSALRYVASQTGVDFNTFGTTISMLEKNLGATGAAGEKVSQALSDMGLDLQTIKNLRPDEAFITVAQALFEVKNNADKAHDAALLMGRGAKEMAALWHEDIGDMIHEAHDLGLVMSTDAAAGAHLAEIGFKSLHLQLEALGMHIANAFLPAIIGIEGDLKDGLTTAVAGLNKELGAAGGSGGFLATVAQAMGTGDVAIAAQVQLYEFLKTTLIELVRYSLEPLITTFGFVMTEFHAGRVIVGDLTQIFSGLALAADYLAKGLAEILNIASFGHFKDEVQLLDAAIGDLLITMKQRGDQLQKDKQAEADWGKWATDANAAVEAALHAVGAAHTDVGKKIKEMGDVSRAAYGAMAEDVDTVTDKHKEEKKALDEARKAAEAWIKTQAAAAAKYAEALAELAFAGDGWKQTLDSIDGETVEAIKYYLAAGVSQHALAEAYGLTAMQIKAVAQALADEKKAHHEVKQAIADVAQAMSMAQAAEEGDVNSQVKNVLTLAGAWITAKQAKEAFDSGGTFSVQDLSDTQFQQLGGTNRIRSIQDSYLANPGRQEGGSGTTGLNAGDAAGWNAVLQERRDLAALLAYARTHHLPGYAGGITNAPGGWAMVGERGPEPMYVPKGASIYPSGSDVGGTQIIHLVVDGRVLASVVNDENTRTAKANRKWPAA